MNSRNLLFPPFFSAWTWSCSIRSSLRLLTKLTCTPSARCMPAHFIHKNIPWLTLIQSASWQKQSQQYWFKSVYNLPISSSKFWSSAMCVIILLLLVVIWLYKRYDFVLSGSWSMSLSNYVKKLYSISCRMFSSRWLFGPWISADLSVCIECNFSKKGGAWGSCIDFIHFIWLIFFSFCTSIAGNALCCCTLRTAWMDGEFDSVITEWPSMIGSMVLLSRTASQFSPTSSKYSHVSNELSRDIDASIWVFWIVDLVFVCVFVIALSLRLNTLMFDLLIYLDV